MTKACSIDGCETPRKAFGYCNRHYIKSRRDGIIASVVPRTGCMFVGCDRPHHCRNLCCMHYRWQTRPLKPQPARPRCTMGNCGRVVKARNLCAMHYMNQLRDLRRDGLIEPKLTEEDWRNFLEEVAWFRSFKMSDEKVAAQFGLSLDAFQARMRRNSEVAA